MDQIHQDHFWSNFRIILFWSFEGHFWSNLDRFDPFSDQYLSMDQIHQDHFWSDFRIKVLICISGSLWSGKDELIFDTAFGSKVILFVSYLIWLSKNDSRDVYIYDNSPDLPTASLGQALRDGLVIMNARACGVGSSPARVTSEDIFRQIFYNKYLILSWIKHFDPDFRITSILKG